MYKAKFLKALQEAGFKSQSAFAKRLGLHQTTITGWLQDEKYPSWLEFLLECAAKARKYDDLAGALKKVE